MSKHVTYPIVLRLDRYLGRYSKGDWTAYNLFADQLPFEPELAEEVAAKFWADEKLTALIGRGSTPDEAVADLKFRIYDKPCEHTDAWDVSYSTPLYRHNFCPDCGVRL
jgi:hypothetical protein